MRTGPTLVLLTMVAAFGLDIETSRADGGQEPVPNTAFTGLPGVISKSPPTRIGNIYGGFDHQPTQSEVLRRERAAGISSSAAQRNRDDAVLQEIYRHLEGGTPADPAGAR
jgi:hypothetical protein